ncbi:unnamed protein product, partial [Polarella glacialis]
NESVVETPGSKGKHGTKLTMPSRTGLVPDGVAGHPHWLRVLRLVQFLRLLALPACRAIRGTKVFQSSMLFALLAALLLPDTWVLANMTNNDDLDIILSIIGVMFIFEIFVNSIVLMRTYFGSFFFYMDILGTISLLFDLSYVGLVAGNEGHNAVVMRAARIAKLGARAGRFTRMIRLLRFLPGMKHLGSEGTEGSTAKAISGKLITALSTRVSCLIIVMVMIIPLFSLWSYPVADNSMQSWVERLDWICQNRPENLSAQLIKLESFFADLEYYPYQLSIKSGSSLNETNFALSSGTSFPWTSSREHPSRPRNLRTHESTNLSCAFNFQGPNQMDAAMNLVLLIFVMVLMVSFSLVLSQATRRIVLAPLDKLLAQVRQTASTIFQSVTDMAVKDVDGNDHHDTENLDEEEAGEATDFGGEMNLLEKVVEKLAALQNKSKDKQEDKSGGWGGGGAANDGGDEMPATKSDGRRPRSVADTPDGEESEYDQMLNGQKKMLEGSGLSLELLDSWNINPLELDRVRNRASAMYFVGPHNHGIRCESKVTAFMEAAESSYIRSNPYHNWFHAVDVSHCVWQLTRQCHASEYLHGHEHLALLVSAICHDVGHPGLNNGFLVETAHELALMYNDRSPLENMHGSKLFEIIQQPETNIFSCLSIPQYKEARKVCIESILNTDNSRHFAMIKEVQMFYEMNSETLEKSREEYSEEPGGFPTSEALEVFKVKEARQLMCNVMLHLADISNSLKPFRISRIWAVQILDEFYQQGDQEKQMGVPVQALNDREKVNRPFSQIGFIEFLVSPLLLTVVKVLHPVEPMLDQMMSNVKSWHQTWLSETRNPPPTAEEKQGMADRVHRLQIRVNEGRS